MTSSPSADEKRLAQIRRIIDARDVLTPSAGDFLLRLLDASQARLAEAENNVQKATDCLAETEIELKAAEERASALASTIEWIIAESPKTPPDKALQKTDYGAWLLIDQAWKIGQRAREALSQSAVTALKEDHHDK